MTSVQVAKFSKPLQTTAQREQTEAINRLAESNVALSDVIIQSLAGDLDEAPEQQTYLSGKPRG
ncbi:hypothetical protein QP245_23430 [Klebsiella pneumoniae]|uniref:hypothetical protein n=1 Tax=Klebsiella pneumoniae TaxID=573 RepID=UPI00254A150D|nr:hypothetical protein [Klebsiella pneumoniae]MDK6650887.1 hypothetical protein [Klebsiella pneumoniae]